ncbi:hypothetical protein PSACC_03720 [Paramicrosporidium saccamoebae]|uniref:Uncharacterized protein n=1 Tax=Paramicrosporidium saccamoebae TaxID=1246581 RepID=A0A2H9TFF1_9FUNG|nr:hypothetical protein PSACC_03720 [Paramicrosporidium saccamoebae]
MRSQKLTQASSESSSKNLRSNSLSVVRPTKWRKVRLHFKISPERLMTQEGTLECAIVRSYSYLSSLPKLRPTIREV